VIGLVENPHRDTQNRSPGKFDSLPYATAGFTTSALDGYGLRGHVPARPAPYASDPVLVHRLVRLLHASFRPRLATTPLRFAFTSPASGCEKDFHLRAVEHARHTHQSKDPLSLLLVLLSSPECSSLWLARVPTFGGSRRSRRNRESEIRSCPQPVAMQSICIQIRTLQCGIHTR